MALSFYDELAECSIQGQLPDAGTALDILTSESLELLGLLQAAFRVRQHFTGREVMVHIINNAQNGFCPEDCHYCAQAKSANADIAAYPMKSEAEILAEAEQAYRSGACRYCMVFAGRGPSSGRVDRLAALIRTIKARYPLEVCVSAGLLDEEKARRLKNAGLDRLNHNLNTSRAHYPSICTTHTYDDRIATLTAARRAGLEVCSGVIVGMGETPDDVRTVAEELRRLNARSIPVNFFMPVEGTALKDPGALTPEYCLRVLCLFRFLNPDAEIRMAAGREMHLRSMQVMGLYPANSLFLEGYLNTRGGAAGQTLRMIRDAGFTIKSDQDLNGLLETARAPGAQQNEALLAMKDLRDLRPRLDRPPADFKTT